MEERKEKNRFFGKGVLAVAGIVIIVVILVMAGNGKGATVNVPVDYPTIQSAIENASDGDTVIVSDGIYNESIVVNKAITLMGEHPPFGGTSVINGTIDVIADGVTIKWLKLEAGNVTGDEAGIGIYASNVFVEENVICSMKGDGTGTIKGIHVYSGGNVIKNISIEDNRIFAINNTNSSGAYGGADGIMIQGNVSNVTINGDTIEDIHSAGWAYGIEITPTNIIGVSPPENITIIENTFQSINDGSVYPVWNYFITGNAPYPGVCIVVDNSTVGATNVVSNASTIEVHYNNFINTSTNPLLPIGGLINKDENHFLNATLNYWGDASGPYDPYGGVDVPPWTGDASDEINADGKGCGVSNYTDYTPWLNTTYLYGVVHNLNTNFYYGSIQPAIDDASDNDTIKVHPGIYKENLVINKPLKLVGDPAIDANGSIGITVEANNTLVENMTIYNFSRGIYVHNASFIVHNVTINNCTLYNFSRRGYGIYFENVEQSIINNTEINDTYAAIFFRTSSYNKITNNTNIFDNSFGIWFLASQYNNISFNNITGGSISSYGLYLFNSDYNLIQNNNISNHRTQIAVWLISSHWTRFIDNKLYGNWRGIMLDSSNNSNVSNNVIFNTRYFAIQSSRASDNTFLNNTVASYPTTFDVNGYNGNFTISGVESPPAMPEGFANISKFLNMTGDGWVNITIYYEPEYVMVNESTLHMWKWNGTAWRYDGWYGFHKVDAANDIITVNITLDADPIFAPLQDVTPPTTTLSKGSPSYGEFITSDTKIWLNATDNANGSGVNVTYYRIWYNNGWHPIDGGDVYCGNGNITFYNGTYWYVYRNATVSIPYIHLCEECYHTIEYFSMDFAGNEEEHNFHTLFVDNTKPEISIEYGQPRYINSSGEIFIGHTPIYINVTDNATVLKMSPGIPMPWIFWTITENLGNYFIKPTIKNFGDETVNVSLEYNLSNTIIPLQNLNWSNIASLSWTFLGMRDISPSTTYAFIDIPIDSTHQAVIIRYNVSVNGEIVARFIGEALINWSGGTPSLNFSLVNFDLLNSLNNSVNNFELEIGGISPDNITEIYNGWGYPPEIEYDGNYANLTWMEENNPILPGEWKHFGIAFDEGVNSADVSSMEANWTVKCAVGVVNVSITVYNESMGSVNFSYSGLSSPAVIFLYINEECTHEINVTASDVLGNTNSTNATVHVDLSPPESMVEVGAPSYYKDSEGMWYVTTHTPVWINTSENYSDANTCDSGCQYLHWEAYIWNGSGWDVCDVSVWNEISGQWENRSSGDESSNRLKFHFNEECHHKIVYYGVDNVSNAEVTHEMEFKVDDTPPSGYVSIGIPSSGNHLTTHTDIQIIANDGGECPVGGYYISYNIWNGTSWVYGWDSLPIFHNINPILNFTEECRHYLWFNVSDELDNYRIYNYTFYVDDTPPTSQINILNHSFVSTSTIFTLTATDGPSSPCATGVREIDYRILKWNGTDWEVIQDWVVGGSTVSFNLTENCTHRVEFYAVDPLENTETVKWYVYYVDATPPATGRDVGNPNVPDGGNRYYVTTSTSIWLNASDEGCNGGAGVAELHYIIEYNGYPYEFVVYDNGNGDWNDTPGNISVNISFNEECNHTLIYWAIDYVGNVEEQHTAYFLVDDTPPMINKTIGEPQYNNSGMLFINCSTPIWVNATDLGLTEECTVGSVMLNVKVYWLLEGPVLVYNQWDNVTDGWAHISFTIDEECVHWINITAIDDLGNVAYHNETVYVDNSPPILEKEVGEPKYGEEGEKLVDQEQLQSDNFYFNYPLLYMWQSFIPSVPKIDAVQLYLMIEDDTIWGWGQYPLTLNVSICDSNWNVLATNTTIWNDDFTGWKQFHFYPGINVIPGETYYINISYDSDAVFIGAIHQDVYPYGNLLGYDDFDAAFKTEYYGTYVTSQTPIYLNITDTGLTNECTAGSLHVRVGIWYNGEWNYAWYNVTESPLNLTVYLGGECIHYLNVTMWDDLGNMAYDNETFYVDNTPPAVVKTLDGPYFQVGEDEFFISNTTEINLSETYDEGCMEGVGMAYITYRIWYDGEWTPWMEYEGPFAMENECLHYLEVNATDLLGNSIIDNETFRVDISPPVSTVSPISPFVQEPVINISATAQDFTGGCASGVARVELWYRYSFDNHSWGEWTFYDIDDVYPWNWSFSAPNGSGYYQFCSIAVDNVENREDKEFMSEAYVGIPLNHTFHLKAPWSIITVPIKNNFSASTLAEQLGLPKYSVITRWDAEEQKYYDYVVGINTPGNPDFDIEDGIGYFVGIASDMDSWVTGLPLENVSVFIREGYNLIGWTNMEDTAAKFLGENITDCIYVTKWNETTQDFESHFVNAPSPGFTIEIGRGVFVWVTSESWWYGGK